MVNTTASALPIVLRLGIDESVMGLPRMAFVLIFGCIGVLIVGLVALIITCCSQRNRKDKNYYSFSLLSQNKPEQRKLFDDDDDDVDETELFRTPIKRAYTQYSLNNRMTIDPK